MRLAYNNAAALATNSRQYVPQNTRARGGEQRSPRVAFAPPEDWHEPREESGDYRFIIQDAGPGFRHVLTPEEIRQRLDELPAEFTAPLDVVQFSRITRKKQSYPCYGMQWGTSIYLYPIEEDLVEDYTRPPRPMQVVEARMYGARWVQESECAWKLIWTEKTIKDFYLNNILVHELGHLLDDRNSSYADRERYAEWFAVHYGYRPTRHFRPRRNMVRRRHHARSA